AADRRDLRSFPTRRSSDLTAVDRAVAARGALVASIDERRDLNAQLTGELQDAQQRLQTSLSQIAAGRAGPAVGLPFRPFQGALRSEEHTSELQSRVDLVCR